MTHWSLEVVTRMKRPSETMKKTSLKSYSGPEKMGCTSTQQKLHFELLECHTVATWWPRLTAKSTQNESCMRSTRSWQPKSSATRPRTGQSHAKVHAAFSRHCRSPSHTGDNGHRLSVEDITKGCYKSNQRYHRSHDVEILTLSSVMSATTDLEYHWCRASNQSHLHWKCYRTSNKIHANWQGVSRNHIRARKLAKLHSEQRKHRDQDRALRARKACL